MTNYEYENGGNKFNLPLHQPGSGDNDANKRVTVSSMIDVSVLPLDEQVIKGIEPKNASIELIKLLTKKTKIR